MQRTSSFVLFGVLVLLIAAAQPTVAAERIFDIQDYGAVPDGKTLNSAAIQKTIEACTAQGGGTVYFPPGVWLSGTIQLRSNVTLRLEAGSRLLGSPTPTDYPVWTPAIRSYTHSYNCQSLIRGEGLEHVGICGRGVIDGNGEHFPWEDCKNRPYGIRLANCRDVLVEGVSMRNSALWMQQYLACEQVVVRGIRVSNHATHNNDGIDLDSCRDAMVSDCYFDTGDDALCLKSTADRPCENIAISNCVLSSSQSAIKMGTESNGGFRHIAISNCTITSPAPTKKHHGRGGGGISLEMVDGGTLDGVAVSNIAIDGVMAPLFLRLGNRTRPIDNDSPKPGMGRFRNVVISNIVATHASPRGCSITGVPQGSIENVQLSNIQISFDGGGTREQANLKPAENEQEYPEWNMFGTLPAYAFYCRHVTGLKMHNVRLRTEKADLRPAIIADDVKGLVIDGFDAVRSPDAAPVVRLSSSPGAVLRNSDGTSVPVGSEQ